MPKFLELVLDLCPLASYIYSNSNSSLIVWTFITESIPSKRLVKLRLGYSLGTTWVLWLDLWWLVAGSAVEAVMGPMLPLRLSWLKLRPNCKRLSARSCQLVKMPNCQIKTKFSSKQSIYLEKSSNQREFAPLLRRPAVCHITDSQQWPICHKFECHKPFRCLLGLPNPTTHPPPESWPTEHGCAAAGERIVKAASCGQSLHRITEKTCSSKKWQQFNNDVGGHWCTPSHDDCCTNYVSYVRCVRPCVTVAAI